MLTPRILSLLVVCAAVWMLAGCSAVPMQSKIWADSWHWTQPVDSLSVIDFVALTDDAQAQRRVDSNYLLDNVSKVSTHAGAVKLMSTAAGLAPDNPLLWIRLAQESRHIGDFNRALLCLDAAEQALPLVDYPTRNDCVLDIALARGWIYRDKGEWASAVAWSDSARGLEPQDRRVQILIGLALASRGDHQGATNMSRHIETTEYFLFEWRWIRGMAAFAQGDVVDAYHWLIGARPQQPWSADFWRDVSMVCERVGDEIEAARADRNALAALNFPPGTTGAIEVTVVSPGATKPLQRVLHMAYDGWPVSGSRLGWALTAADSALSVTDPERRLHWMDRASELLSTAISYDFQTQRCRELRGLVYQRAGAENLARQDFQRVVADAPGLQSVDPEVLLGYGHLVLRDKSWRRAIPLLRAGLGRLENNAQGWGDLGLALLMTNQNDAGNEALGRALVLDPDLAAAWYNRGLARFHAKQWKSAARDLARAAELASDNQDILKLLQQAEQRARLQRR